MAINDLTIEVGKGMFAKSATYDGDRIELRGVDSSDIVALATPEEIAEEVNLIEILQALVKKHGLGEVIYTLVENNDTTEIIKEVYGADDDAVRSWVSDTFSDDE